MENPSWPDSGDGTSFTDGDKFPIWWSSTVYYFADSNGPVYAPISVTNLNYYLPWTECRNESDPPSQFDGNPLWVTFPFQIKINSVASVVSGPTVLNTTSLPDPPGYLQWHTYQVDSDVAHPDLYTASPNNPSVYTETLADPIYVDAYTAMGVDAQFGPLTFESLGADIELIVGCHMMSMGVEVVVV